MLGSSSLRSKFGICRHYQEEKLNEKTQHWRSSQVITMCRRNREVKKRSNGVQLVLHNLLIFNLLIFSSRKSLEKKNVTSVSVHSKFIAIFKQQYKSISSSRDSAINIKLFGHIQLTSFRFSICRKFIHGRNNARLQRERVCVTVWCLRQHSERPIIIIIIIIRYYLYVIRKCIQKTTLNGHLLVSCCRCRCRRRIIL